MKNFCILNGQLERIDKISVCSPFVMNESIWEEIMLYNTSPICLAYYYKRIRQTAEYLNINLPQNFSLDKIDRYISRLLNVNKVYKGGICRLMIFRHTYPEVSETQFAILINPVESGKYDFNSTGICIGFDSNIKIREPFFSAKYSGDLRLQNAIKSTFVENADTLFITDESNNILSSSQGDVVFLTDKTIHYCTNKVSNAITDLFMNHLKQKDWEIEKHNAFTLEQILHSNEILIINPIFGIRWVNWILGETEKVFGYIYTKRLHNDFLLFLENGLV